jgi:tRNA threonylcarbamoyladenosine biosynthesis protein TsaE
VSLHGEDSRLGAGIDGTMRLMKPDHSIPEMTLITHAPAETEQLGKRIGARLRAGDLLCLAGDLGAGKTCLTRGLARGWGAVERPTSPTFKLVNEYRREDGGRMYHVDCYRLSGEADAWTIGLDDLFDQGVVVIEWPERIGGALPAARLWVAIDDLGGDDRRFVFTASGERGRELVADLEDT